jgi:D-galactose 1-dehydrogenase
MRVHTIGIVGLGKIARDQHVPVIRGSQDYRLLAASSQRRPTIEGVPHLFDDYREMLALRDLDAVAICTPPQVRHVIAQEALLAGKHVLLEKPPAATLSELADLKRIAERQGRVLFTTWHSQYNRAVDEAKRRLAGEKVRRLRVSWREDVRQWHPGQKWIWEAGGFGVFDPGINALSIVTRILPEPIFVRRADLEFPANADTPIAARLQFSDGSSDAELSADFDWREKGPRTCEIEIVTQDGTHLKLSGAGTRLDVDGQLAVEEKPAEYEGIYRRFAELLREKHSDVDEAPFRLTADAFMIGRRIAVEPFEG